MDEIILLYEYKTTNDILLESLVHDILKKYKSNSNREHFWCQLNYLKNVIDITGNMLDVLKSSFQYITRTELLERLRERLTDTLIEEATSNLKHMLTNDLKSKQGLPITKQSTVGSDGSNISLNIPSIAYFLKTIIDQNHNKQIIIYKSSQLFDLYKKFFITSNMKYEITATRFGIDISNYEGVDKKKDGGYIKVTIDIELLKAYLIKKYNFTFI